MARRHGQSVVPDDLSAQIQAHRQKLEALQATFSLDGVEITKQYQALDAQRKALKPDDAAAITKFNEAAAAYQAKNTARKQMQGQIETTQHELDTLLDTRSRQAAKGTSNKKVVMYATNHCPAAEAARQYFVKNGVHYEEINVEGNRASYDEFKSRGGTVVPLIFVDNQRFDGFNAFRLDLALR
jgi:glutaredoxin